MQPIETIGFGLAFMPFISSITRSIMPGISVR